MMNSVVKGCSYILVHAPDMVLHNGTTQTTEKIVNPESEYLKALPNHLRSYEKAVSYYPNQTFIGNITPEQLGAVEFPWYDKDMADATRYGKFGEIMPQDEFYLLIEACDVFDLVKLDKDFVAATKDRLAADPIITPEIIARIGEGIAADEIRRLVEEEHAEGLYNSGVLVGCVKNAHDIDQNLSGHVMLENLVSKATSVLSLLYVVRNAGIDTAEVEYVIDCCEEACGDMNQRGGGNFAKASAEIAGFSGATGSDTRGFCAAPAHAMVEAAALCKAGTFNTVVVTAGGCTAKLGMNGKDHVKKNLPIMEDCLAGFAVVLTPNDGVNPEVNSELIGRHTVGTGSSPQAVISSLVTGPLDRAGLSILDVDKYSPEMQNPDVTKPAGAGDVPLANYKMIGALAAKRGEITPKELNDFVAKHGLTGYAPTQGHIPSGVPYIGFAREEILAGNLNRVMIVGKGSLFLGRMTNLFDGVSFLMQPNAGKSEATQSVSEDQIKGLIAQSLREFAESLLSAE